MKILMINVVCGIRSTGRICTDLATALEAQGHEKNVVIIKDDKSKLIRRVICSTKERDYYLVHFSLSQYKRTGYFTNL